MWTVDREFSTYNAYSGVLSDESFLYLANSKLIIMMMFVIM